MSRLMSAIAIPGLSPLGHVRAQSEFVSISEHGSIIQSKMHTHDGVATVDREAVLEGFTTFSSVLIARVNHPAVSLHQNRRSEVNIRVPPIRGARCWATSTQDALVQSIQLLAVLNALKVFLAIGRRSLLLQEWFNGSVLTVKMVKVLIASQLFKDTKTYRNQILHNIHVRKRINLGDLTGVTVQLCNAGKRVSSIDVHGTTSTDSFTATTTECQSRIDLILDFEQGVQHHGSTCIQVHFIFLQTGLFAGLLRIPTINLNLLHDTCTLFNRRSHLCGSRWMNRSDKLLRR